MASKELISQVEQIIWQDRARVIPSRSTDLANEILAAILAALQEPTEGMIEATGSGTLEDRVNVQYDWRAMINASALGEQSE